jgi:uncharacterized protein YxjI
VRKVIKGKQVKKDNQVLMECLGHQEMMVVTELQDPKETLEIQDPQDQMDHLVRKAVQAKRA